MARVFLSYSRHDLSTAECLAADLGRLGHEVWWDSHLQGGARFASEIETALEQANAVVVLWSTQSLKSAWVQDEAAEGRDSGRLVPVLIDDSKPPLGFRQFHAIPYRQRKGATGKAALDAINSAIAGLTSDLETAPTASILAVPLRRTAKRNAAIGSVALIMAIGAVALFWQLSDLEPAPPRLQLGQFNALAPDVPAAVPAALREEILSALGTDGRIDVSEAGQAGSSESRYVVSGSIRTTGEMLRFTIHLSDSDRSKTLWTTTFERPIKNADVAPRQVAAAASLVLRCGLTGQAQHEGFIDPEALALYLNYCAEFWAETGGRTMSASRGLDFARRVVELEPKFARGWSARARMASWASNGAPQTSAAALRAEAEDAARRAIAIDPSNSQAYETLALLQPRNTVARERLHAKSVSVRPGDCGCEHVGYGGFLSGVGRLTESIAQFQRAMDMVPLSVSVNASLAESLFAAGRKDEAAKLVTPILDIWPNDRQMHDMLVRTAFWTGRTEPALRSLSNSETHFTAAERVAYATALKAVESGGIGARQLATERLKALALEPGAGRALLITALAALGAEREAIAVASNLFAAGNSPEQYVLFEPAMARARHAEEFAALAGRIGLTRYWRESRRAPEFCRARDAPKLCTSLSQRPLP